MFSYICSASPVITVYPSLSNNDVVIGSPLTLTCTSSGSPPDTFTWMKDGISITHSTNITTVNYTNIVAVFNSNYVISNFSTNDIGTYTCTVSNPIGNDSKTIIGNLVCIIANKSLCEYIRYYMYVCWKIFMIQNF